MKYFVVNNGVQEGPFTVAELRLKGIEPTTYVWRQGLTDWVQAENLPELAEVLDAGSAFGSYAEAPTPPPFVNDNRAPKKNLVPLAIVTVVLGALFSFLGMIFGIIAVMNANTANKAYAMGAELQGDMKNRSARTLIIIGLILVVLGAVLAFTGVSERIMNHLISSNPILQKFL